jgi:hypothetical protein
MRYLEVISRKYPELQVSTEGDDSVYENLVAEKGILPTKEALDAAHIECAKEDMWLEIKAERDRRKAAGVKVGEHWFHSDDASRIQQIALTMLGASMPANLMWKTMTGQFVPMSQTLASEIFQTSIQSDTTIFGIAENHRQQMLGLPDPRDYDFSGGWPMTFEESPQYNKSGA